MSAQGFKIMLDIKWLTLLLLLFPSTAFAGGNVPAVNLDMGCTITGQILGYDGTNIVCWAPHTPITTVSALPTCNTATKGTEYIVTDALLPNFLVAVAGSDAVVTKVGCDGTNWIVGL